MRKIIVLLFVMSCGILISSQQAVKTYQGVPGTSVVYAGRSCDVEQGVTRDYRSAIYDLSILLFKSVAVRSDFNFVYSPISTWIMLAAIAEGSEPLTQQKLFQILSLPNDSCIRQAYYQLATTRAFPTNDVNIKSTRALLIDERSTFNQSWYDLIVRNSLLDVVTAPIRYNPVATANEIKRIMSAQLPRLDLTGNSVLLDTFDYNGLWTTAFADATVDRALFYNIAGQQIGTVDLMWVRRRARMGFIEKLQAKILELPIGSDGRYRMLFSLIVANNDIRPAVATVNKEIVFEIFGSLQESYVQIDVAIPRMVVTSEVDVRTILENLGVTDLWTNPTVTRYISEPPAFPSSFVQRSTVVLNNTGLETPALEQDPPYGARTGLEPVLGRDFIADRPFLFALFDTETDTCLMAAAYTSPTYTL